MKNVLRIGAKLLIGFFALLGVLHLGSSYLGSKVPSSAIDRVLKHRSDLRANDVAALIDLAALARRFESDKTLVARLKPIEYEATARTQTLIIPKDMIPTSYSRTGLFSESYPPGYQGILVCDREGKPLYMHLRSAREGLFIGIDPNAIPHGDNLMLKVYEHPPMYAYAHEP